MLLFLAALLACAALQCRSVAVLLATGLGIVAVFVLASVLQASFNLVSLLVVVAGFNGAIIFALLLLVAFHSKGGLRSGTRDLPRPHGLTR